MSYCCKDKFKLQEVGDNFQLLQGGSVTSVNGKVGAVVLTAADVGALPDTYEAPVTSVNTQIGDVVLDAGDIAYETTTVEEELGTINSALSSLSSVTEIIDTASGAIASFPDGAGLPMRSLVAQIEPQQDLHGYTQPWAGGSGKNKLKPPATQTVSGVTCTLNADGTVTLTGTATGNAYFDFNDGVFDSHTYAGYKFRFYSVGGYGTVSTISVRSSSASDRVTLQDFLNNEQTITDYGDGIRLAIRVNSGYAIPSGGATFYPALLAPSETDTTFAPYSNECPISGWTGLSGERLGVNQWDEEVESGYISSDGSLKTNASSLRSKNFCPCKGNVEYRFVKPSSYSVTPNICWYDENETFISRTGTSGFPLLTSPANASFFKVSMWEYGSTYNHDISINYPSTDTAYHAYTSLPITVTWQTEAGTVYGGTVDVVSGLLKVDRLYIEYDGSSDEFWVYSSGWSKTNTNAFYCSAIPYHALYTSYDDVYLISNLLPSVSRNTAYANDVPCIGYSGTYNEPYPSIRVPKATASTAEELRTWLQSNPLQVVYLLNQPQTYQLSPQQISTLIGNNTVFVDTGAVSVTYQASIKGYIDKVLAS